MLAARTRWRYTMIAAMTTTEFCRTAGLTERELQNWIDYGLLARFS
jgi:hypothetical protein